MKIVSTIESSTLLKVQLFLSRHITHGKYIPDRISVSQTNFSNQM